MHNGIWNGNANEGEQQEWMEDEEEEEGVEDEVVGTVERLAR